MERHEKIKKRTFEIISKAEKGDTLSAVFDWTIVILILLSVLMIILESFQDLRIRYTTFFRTFEIITVSVFSVEYLLRIWTADLLYPEAKRPRLRYFFSIMALIDLIAILPSLLPFISADLRFLRMIRLFRLFRLLRILKLGRYVDAWDVILKVIKNTGPQLVMSVILCLFVMLFSSIIMYEVEFPVQPEKFPNVMASLWWAMCTLTTVGYGDIYPITPVGKFFASVISLVGIGIIAIPTGIITAGFSRAIGNAKEQKENGSDFAPGSLANGMGREELLALQMEVSERLKKYGVTTTISIKGEEKKE